MAEWSPDIALTDDDAAALIHAQWPELVSSSCTRVGEGWDNTVYLVDGTWVFRFPRRANAVPGLRREMDALPHIAPLVPVPIPNPVFRGVATEKFPHPFFGYARVPGRESCAFHLRDDERAGLAPSVGRFLRALHDPVLVEKVGASLPHDPVGRSRMEDRVDKGLVRLKALEEAGLSVDTRQLSSIFAGCRPLPREPIERVIHGDLHFRHLMLDDGKALSGVIDWGDLSRNEPCVDLHLHWSFFPPSARRAFLDAYGPVSSTQLAKARAVGIFLGAVLAVYGHQEKLFDVRDEALHSLELIQMD